MAKKNNSPRITFKQRYVYVKNSFDILADGQPIGNKADNSDWWVNFGQIENYPFACDCWLHFNGKHYDLNFPADINDIKSALDALRPIIRYALQVIEKSK